jgi:translation elongation factor EF-Ts
MSMGFTQQDAQVALNKCHGNMELALELLLNSGGMSQQV